MVPGGIHPDLWRGSGRVYWWTGVPSCLVFFAPTWSSSCSHIHNTLREGWREKKDSTPPPYPENRGTSNPLSLNITTTNSNNTLSFCCRNGLFFNIHECSNFAPSIPQLLFASFQMMFAAMVPVIITGAWAERVRMGVVLGHTAPHCIVHASSLQTSEWQTHHTISTRQLSFQAFIFFSAIWPFLVYYPVAHWIWGNGFLGQWWVYFLLSFLLVYFCYFFVSLLSSCCSGSSTLLVGFFFIFFFYCCSPSPSLYVYVCMNV